MKFINRKAEKGLVKECRELSERKLYSLCIYGLRRIGKTRLILESLNNKDLYFFVNRDKQSTSLLKEYESYLRSKNIISELEYLKDWNNFFKVIFERYRGVVVFDEFQNFGTVDKSIFGILQKYMDLNENKRGILFIFSGSTIGLIKNAFFDKKQPLYGRVKRKLHMKQLSFHNVFLMCRELGIKDMEEIIVLYSVFGGFPKYYIAMEDEMLKHTREILNKFFFSENAVFEDEVETILSLEFGRRRGVYYDIISAIANGNTKISEISSYLGKKETSLTRQVDELINYFNIIGVEKQMIGKKTMMRIEHPLLEFWFRFFYKSLSKYKSRDKSFIEKTKHHIPDFIGKRFEDICREMIKTQNIFEINSIGRQWGKFKGEKGKNIYEIDIVGLNEKANQILFGECKWKDNINPEKVLKELKNKAENIDYEGERYYAIFAKSFKQKIKEKNVLLFDLNDIEKMLKK